MNQREIKRHATQFVRGLLGGETPGGMCYAVSVALQGYLSAVVGVQTELVKSDICDARGAYWQHYYLRLPDGRIIDGTASQFNNKTPHVMPLVYVGAKPEWYEEG